MPSLLCSCGQCRVAGHRVRCEAQPQPQRRALNSSRDPASKQRKRPRRPLYAAIGALAVWFCASVALMVVMDTKFTELIESNEIFNHNISVVVAAAETKRRVVETKFTEPNESNQVLSEKNSAVVAAADMEISLVPVRVNGSAFEAPSPPPPKKLEKPSWTDQVRVNGSAFEAPPPPPPKKLEKPSLAVISACIPGKRFSTAYINASLANKQHFCDKWNATCVLSTEKHDVANPTHHAKWEKLYLINQALHNSAADWIMWLDCDAAFTNMAIDWRTHLRGHLHNSKALITSKDKNGINLGALFLPNTVIAHEFIDELYEMRHYVEANPNKRLLKDQAALTEMLAKKPEWNQFVDSTVPQEKINSFFDNPDGHQWKPNDWIAHQVWCMHADKCTAHFLSVLKNIKP